MSPDCHNSRLLFLRQFVSNGVIAERNIARFVKKSVERAFHRNGQLREEVPLRDGQRHGDPNG